MRRALLTLLLACGACYGQGSNTIFQQLFSNSAGGTSSLVQNIGQPYHLVYAVFADAPAQTCTVLANKDNNGPSITINVSFDNVIYQDITNSYRVVVPNNSSPTNRYRMLASASGNFPYLNVSITSFDATKCVMSAWYSGGLVAIDIKKLFSFYSGLNDVAVTIPIDLTSSSTATIPALSFGRINVYGLLLYNSTTVQTVTFRCRLNAGGASTLFVLDTIAANSSFSLSNAGNPYFACQMNQNMEIVTSAAGPLSGFITLRNE